jgi:hypothetical protein
MRHSESSEAADVDAVSIPNTVPSGRTYVLSKNIRAIQITPEGEGEQAGLGLIIQLPEGAELDVCGNGFDNRTAKVRCNDAFYFVFLEDLEPPKKPAAYASHAG